MPVILEDEAMNRRIHQRALVFRLDDFAYSQALRAILPISPVFADRLFFVMPSRDQVQVDLFTRLPEVGLPPDQHRPAWAAIQSISRFLMKDVTLLTIVRGEPKNGSVNLGYHASESYDVVERCIQERIGVSKLSELATALRTASQPLDEDVMQHKAREMLELSAIPTGLKSEIAAYLQGQSSWSSALEAPEATDFLLMQMSRIPTAFNALERRASHALSHPAGFLRWLENAPVSPLLDTFSTVLAEILATKRLSEDSVVGMLFAAEGGKSDSGPWWWTLRQLGDPARCVRALHAMEKPLSGVSGLCGFAAKIKGELPSVVDAVREVCSADSSWRALARRMLS